MGKSNKRKWLMDSRGHDIRPELLSLLIDRTPRAHMHERGTHLMPVTGEEDGDTNQFASRVGERG